jgi:hypothetical protein
MPLQAVSAQAQGKVAPLGSFVGSSSPLTQPGFRASAYLLSLSGPAATILDGTDVMAASTSPLGLVQTSQGDSEVEAAPDAVTNADRDVAAATANATQASQLADDARAAAIAAAAASNAATNAFYAANASGAVSQGSASVATDATAKYMGAGAMGLPDRAMSAYLAIQNAIPAVGGVLAASAMAANTSSNPQNGTPGRAQSQVPAMTNGGNFFDFLS